MPYTVTVKQLSLSLDYLVPCGSLYEVLLSIVCFGFFLLAVILH